MSCPVVLYHPPSDVNRSGQLILQSVANPGIEGKFTIICRLTIIAKHLSARYLIVQPSRVVYVCMSHYVDYVLTD